MTHQERLLRVLIHVERHLDDDLALDRLADIAGFSPFHFHRIFKGATGESVAAYVRRLRLERTARLLVNTDASVGEIAARSGYENHESFTRMFTRQYGCAPSVFRHRPHSKRDTALDVEITTIEPVRVAFIRHVGPYRKVGSAWGRIHRWAGRRGLLKRGRARIGVSHDDPDVTADERLRYDACLEIEDADVEPTGDVGVQTLRGGRYAVFTHRGAFSRLPETYDAFFGAWLPRSGLAHASWSPAEESGEIVPPDELVETLVLGDGRPA